MGPGGLQGGWRVGHEKLKMVLKSGSVRGGPRLHLVFEEMQRERWISGRRGGVLRVELADRGEAVVRWYQKYLGGGPLPRLWCILIQNLPS